MEPSSSSNNNNQIGRKEITEDMVGKFSETLDNLKKKEPEISWTATKLIQEHKEQINELLELGYKTKQIAEILEQELKLTISPTLIRRALSNVSK